MFRASDVVVVPVIPTTPSQRTFEQLQGFFRDNDLPPKRISAFFSMVQSVKSLHGQTMTEMREAHPKRFLPAQIPSASEVERMGVHRAPVTATATKSVIAGAYRASFCPLVTQALCPQLGCCAADDGCGARGGL